AHATLIVVSKGDEALVQFDRRKAWHFPQNENGVYAGHYPANSADAISQLKLLIAKGGDFLLLPNTAFWWLEHYRELREWLERSHTMLCRDERCAIYRLTREVAATSGRRRNLHRIRIGASRIGKAPTAPDSVPASKAGSGRKRPDLLC